MEQNNARIEHDKALVRVRTAALKDDAQLFKQVSDDDKFRRWLIVSACITPRLC